MTVIPFDTLAYAKKLRLSGISEEQAEAMTNAMSQVLEAKDIATKQDIKDSEISIRQDFKALEATTKQDIKDSEVSIRQDFKALEATTKQALKDSEVSIRQDFKALEASTKISLSEAKVEILKWMVGMMLAQTGIIIGVIKVFL